MSNSLTPEEIEQERQIENRRIAFLDAKLAALTRQQRKQAMNYLTRTAKQAVGLLHARATRWKLFQLSGDLIRLKFTIFSTKHNVRGHTGRVASGAAWADKNMIGILDHFALAPKEVIQKVVIHECLHILHPLIRHKSNTTTRFSSTPKKNGFVKWRKEYADALATLNSGSWRSRKVEITGNSSTNTLSSNTRRAFLASGRPPILRRSENPLTGSSAKLMKARKSPISL